MGKQKHTARAGSFALPTSVHRPLSPEHLGRTARVRFGRLAILAKTCHRQHLLIIMRIRQEHPHCRPCDVVPRGDVRFEVTPDVLEGCYVLCL